jgi:glycosyltransferase involved in cell wall biosynthesis
MAMVRKYESENRRHDIVVVSERDNGLYDAMNKALQLAKGDYVVFLNAGDMLHADDTLERMADKIGNNRYGVVYGDTDIVDAEGHFIAPRRLRPPEHLTWKSFRDGMLVCHQAFYANVDIARQTGYDVRYRLSADVDWCIRVMKEADAQGLPMLNTGMVLCDYLDGGMSVTNHRASLLERFSIMRRHYGLLTTIYKHITFLFRSW